MFPGLDLYCTDRAPRVCHYGRLGYRWSIWCTWSIWSICPRCERVKTLWKILRKIQRAKLKIKKTYLLLRWSIKSAMLSVHSAKQGRAACRLFEKMEAREGGLSLVRENGWWSLCTRTISLILILTPNSKRISLNQPLFSIRQPVCYTSVLQFFRVSGKLYWCKEWHIRNGRIMILCVQLRAGITPTRRRWISPNFSFVRSFALEVL